MTLQELTYDLKELIRNAHIIDDERIDDRLLYIWIHQQRALLAKQNGDKGVFYDDPLLQDYIVDLEYVKSNVSSKSSVLRSVSKIEPIVPLKYGNSILELRGNDLTIDTAYPTPSEHSQTTNQINIVPWNQLVVAGENKFTSRLMFGAIRDGYYYIKYGKNYNDRGHLKQLIIRGVFENPTNVPNYNIYTTPYPISLAMIAILKRIILQSDLSTVLTTKSDSVNDGSGTVENNVQ